MMSPRPFLAAVLLGAALAVAAPTSLMAQSTIAIPAADPRTISVTGDAEVLVEPDHVVVIVASEARDMDPKKARAECHRKMAAVLESARRFGIEEKDLATDNLHLEPIYRWGGEEQIFNGFVCRKSLVITLRRPEKLDELVELVVASGANMIQGIEFRTTELRRHRDEARRMALQAAREKAEAMAAVLGQRIGAPRNISENVSTWEPPMPRARGMAQNAMMMQDGAGEEAVSSTALGRIRVRATVSVVFDLREAGGS